MFLFFVCLFCFFTGTICDALQQNREQVAQAYFEIWAIEVAIWVKITHPLILRFIFI